MKKSQIVKATVASLLTVAAVTVITDEAQAKKGMEKCFGVVKAGANSCGAKGHSCAGQAKTDGEKTEWLYLPKGTCDKIVGGITK